MTRDIGDLVVLETMPAWLRSSHRAARNFGNYPPNGAVRVVTDRATAEEMIEADADGYDSIINADITRYPIMGEFL